MALVGALLLAAATASAAPGDLDPSFDGDGKVLTNVGSGNDFSDLFSVAIQSDGKIVASGYAHNGTDYDIAVVRYNTDGSPDLTFDGDGKVVTPIGLSDDIAYGIAVQSDGKIVVAGYSCITTCDIAVVRYTDTGALDSTFDGDGVALIPVGPGADIGVGIAIQSDGKIVVSGYASNGTDSDIAVVRLEANGTPDATFSGDGIATTQVNGDDFGFGIALQSDGKIVVSGYSCGATCDMIVARYNDDATPDSGFNGDGVAVTSVPLATTVGFGVAVQSDSKIVVTGYVLAVGDQDIAVARYLSDGTPDTSFDGDGMTITPLSPGSDVGVGVALQPDGKIVVGGYSCGSTCDVAVLRYDGSGTLDPSFDGDGVAITPVGTGTDYSFGVALQSDGKIVVTGASHDGLQWDFAALRYLGDPVCGNGAVEGGEQCDDGGILNGDCCSATCQYDAASTPCVSDGETCTSDVCDGSGVCTHPAGNGGATCRPIAGLCDLAEQCDGITPTCPADQVVSSTTSCRASADLCDAEELCDGVSATCPADGALDAGTPCRAAAGVCDLAEQCDGTSLACPTDLKSTAPCRPVADLCDAAETCDGAGDDCPADGFALLGTPCRADAGACDVAEACTGSSAACPVDAKEPDGTSCSDEDTCTMIDSCQSGVCSGADPIDCDDGNACTNDSCTPSGGCVNDDAPATGCLTAAKSILLVRQHPTDDGKDKLLWKWIKGGAVTQMALADPTVGTEYALCVYAGTAGSLIAGAELPAGSGWSALGSKGYKFKGTSPNGLTNALIKGGDAGKSKALVKGSGAALPDPPLPLSYPITVQLKKVGSPLCMESTFDAADEKKNTDTKFKAKAQ